MVSGNNFSEERQGKQYVGAIVVAPNGHILCQLRDDIPDIHFPGCWIACPGGLVESGETHDEAIRREMKEEFNIKIKDIEPLTKFALEGEYAGSYFVFATKLASPASQVQCNEGQKVEFFPPQEVLKLGQPEIPTGIFKKYLDTIEIRM